MKTFGWVALLLGLSLCNYAMAGIKVFSEQNFKIEIPDDFSNIENPLRQRDDFFDSGRRYKNGGYQTILIETMERTRRSNIEDPSAVAALESWIINGKISSSEIKTYNGQQFLVVNVALKDLNKVYYIICADDQTIYITFGRTLNGDPNVSADPDAKALINSFQFLNPPYIPNYLPGCNLAFNIVLTIIFPILIVIAAMKYWLDYQSRYKHKIP